jgi:hypothetical protein
MCRATAARKIKPAEKKAQIATPHQIGSGSLYW